AEAVEDRGELDADRAAAQDRDRLRHFLQVNRLVARDDALVIDRDAGPAARRRTGRADDVRRGQLPVLAAGDLHAVPLREARRAPDPVYAVLLEQALDALREPGDDLVLAGVDGGDVE